MPDYSDEIKGKLEALRNLPAAERKPAEVVSFRWDSGLRVYSTAPFDHLRENLSANLSSQLGYDGPLIVSLLPDKNTPFADLPRTNSISEDTVDFTFSNLDGEISRLITGGREGVEAEVWGYWAGVDLLLLLWRGLTKAPKEMSRAAVKLQATTGRRSPQALLPHRPHATSCPFIFGALFSTQEEIDFHQGCPFNAHLTVIQRGGRPLVGVPGFTDCSRAVVGDCFARMTEPDTETQTKRFWPGFDVKADPIANNQTKGPNLLATAQGNASNLSDPVRVIIGERLVKSLALLAYRNETNTNHPDKGFGAGVFEVGEGPGDALWNFYMNGVFVGMEHQNLRLGDLGQPATFFSPNIGSFSGTMHAFGRIQGSFNENQAASLTASIMCRGLRNIRAYTDANTYTEVFSQNRMDAILAVLTNPRWGDGNDYARYDLNSVVICRQWCNETVAMHDANGNLFTGLRSTCNVELNGRAIQQQLTDLCVAGRIGLPFEFQGKEVFTPLKKEDLSDPDSIPTFTDEGPDRNIVFDGAKSTLTYSYTSDADLTNQWTVPFDDAANGYAETQLIFGEQRAQRRAGRAWGQRSSRIINKSQPAFGITNFSEAARFGNFLLYLGPLDAGGVANPWEVKFTTWYSEALFVQMHKPIRVLNAEMQALIHDYYTAPHRVGSYPWYAGESYEYFRVKKITRKGDLKVEIVAQLYAHDFMEQIEDVTEPPPIFVGSPEVNPGGRRDEQPEPITILGLEQIGDRLRGRFDVSVF
jgi:hypothetical protein